MNHSIKYHVLKFTVPHSLSTEGSYKAGSGNAKPGIFINKIPRIANPRRLSRIIILSCWLVGETSVGIGSFVIQLVLVVLMNYDYSVTKKDSKGKNKGWEDLQVKKVVGINKPTINKNKS